MNVKLRYLSSAAFLFGWSGCGTAALGISQAHAQAATSQSAAALSKASEDIVVTARRRAERLQKVPQSITAFSETKLREQAISSALDLNKAVPGLTVAASSGSPGLPVFSIRGRGQNYGAAAGDVETYFADVPLSGPFQAPGLPPQFFDLASLQVLKGPQGTLFGRSTTGGAVLVVPQPPLPELGGYLRLQGGTYGDFQAEGAVNVPLATDKAALRIAFFDWQRDGYSHTNPGTIQTLTGQPLPSQTYNNQDEKEVRATFTVTPTDALKNSTIFTYHNDNNIYSAGAGLVLVSRTAAGPAPGYGTKYSDSDVLFQPSDTKTYAVINTTTYDLTDYLTLKNIFSYIHAEGNTSQGTNSDGTSSSIISLPAVPRLLENRQLTDEFQLQGHWMDNRLTGILGMLYDQSRQPYSPNGINIESIDFVGPCAGIPSCNNVATTFADNRITSYGLFGSVTYKFTPKLSLTAGYRHSWDDVALLTGTAEAPVLQTPYAEALIPATLGASRQYSKDFEGNTYNVDLDYSITDQTLTYVGYRRGYKRGGFNPSQTDPTLAHFAPETIDDFNAGFKTQFNVADVPVRFNLEGFYDLYHGDQVSYLGLSPTYQITTITTNIDDTTFRGFDADFTVIPTEWFTLNGNYGFVDAFNTKWIDRSLLPLTQSLANNPVPFVSRNKFTVTGRFHTQLEGDKGEIAVAPTLSYQDSFLTYPNALTLPLASQELFGNFSGKAAGGDRNPQYFLLDLRAEWNHVMGSRFSAAFNATNLLNKTYYLGNSATILFGYEGYAYGPPRLFTFEVSTKF